MSETTNSGSAPATATASPSGFASPLQQRFATGDLEVLPEILDTYGPRIRARLASRYGAMLHEDEIEDAVLTALADAWRRRQQFDPGRGSLLTWLRGMAHKHAAGLLRASWRQLRLHHEKLKPSNELDDFQTPDDANRIDLAETLEHQERQQPDSPETERALFVGLGQLGETERYVVLESVANGRPPAEVAADLGLSRSTVRTVAARALHKLRSRFRDMGWHCQR